MAAATDSAVGAAAAGSGGEEPSNNAAVRWIADTIEAVSIHPYTAELKARAARLGDAFKFGFEQTTQALADVVQSGLYQHLPPANLENAILFAMCSALGSVLAMMASRG